MAAKLTRQQLYALVWERPITKLESEFGLSDVALHKICRKFRIPTPPVGFWMKKAHGKPVTITPLPDPEDLDEILVREGTASDEPEAIADARSRDAGGLERGVADVYGRLRAADRPVLEEGRTTCCYAKSEKSWVANPDGVVWETFYTGGEARHSFQMPIVTSGRM